MSHCLHNPRLYDTDRLTIASLGRENRVSLTGMPFMGDADVPPDWKTGRQSDAIVSSPRLSLRILATSDLHMNLGGGPGRASGLVALAPVIARERAGCANALLFDNGDLIEGTALADEIARTGLGAAELHPAIAALNSLGYDAATLGNHDFSFGTAFLARAMRDAAYPITSANADVASPKPIWSSHVILARNMQAQDGSFHPLRIGVFGVLPPQTTEWEPELAATMRTHEVLPAAARAVKALQDARADVIVALSHGGFANPDASRENAAAEIARISGVDAIIAGHTHQVLTEEATPESAAVVMPGFGGSHLGVIDMTLERRDGRWKVISSAPRNQPASDLPCPRLTAIVRQLPKAASQNLDQQVTWLTGGITSYFALLGVDPAARIVAAALRAHVAAALPGTPPGSILIASPPFRAGGRSGPAHYLFLEPGPIRKSDLSALYPFANRVCALAMTGADIMEWLNAAAQIFAPLPEFGSAASQCGSGGSGAQAQDAAKSLPLLDPLIAPFMFDVIDGLDYTIDLQRPPGQRVCGILLGGNPLRPSDQLIVVTNSYRMTCASTYRDLVSKRIDFLAPAARARVRDIVAAYLAGKPAFTPDYRPMFRLAGPRGARFWLDTAPRAQAAQSPVAAQDGGLTLAGFRRLNLSFGPPRPLA